MSSSSLSHPLVGPACEMLSKCCQNIRSKHNSPARLAPDGALCYNPQRSGVRVTWPTPWGAATPPGHFVTACYTAVSSLVKPPVFRSFCLPLRSPAPVRAGKSRSTPPIHLELSPFHLANAPHMIAGYPPRNRGHRIEYLPYPGRRVLLIRSGITPVGIGAETWCRVLMMKRIQIIFGQPQQSVSLPVRSAKRW